MIDYKQLDSRLQNKPARKEYLEKVGYEYWYEMLYDLHVKKEMSPTDIVNHIINTGYTKGLSIESIRGNLNRADIYIKRGKKVKTKVKVVPVAFSKKKKICYMCKKRNVAAGNFATCMDCGKLIKSRASNVDSSYYRVNVI